MNKFIPVLIMSSMLVSFFSCSTQEKTEVKIKDGEKTLPNQQKSEFKETSIQIKGVSNETKLENEFGIMVVRFILEDSKENILDKLPNFRIRGPRNLEIDNSPTNIRKDAVHIYILPAGKYFLSSIYAVNDKGEYLFDKPFPPNFFTIASGKINYIGDVKVRVEEEAKGGSVFSQKLKLKLPANNEETITVIQDKLKDLLSKYSLERSIITLQ